MTIPTTVTAIITAMIANSRIVRRGKPGRASDMAIGDITIRTVTRADGTIYEKYQGEYRDRDGNRRFVSHTLKKEAQRLLREKMNSVDSGTHAKGNETLGQVIDEFIYDLEKRARIGEISQAGRVTATNGLRLVSDRLRRMKIRDFRDIGLIKEHMRALREKGYAIGTVQNCKQTLARVFTFATQSPRNCIPRSIMRDFPFSVGKQPKRKNKSTKAEAAAMICAARKRIGRTNKLLLSSVNLYGILCFIITTGMRPEEGLRLTDPRHPPFPIAPR